MPIHPVRALFSPERTPKQLSHVFYGQTAPLDPRRQAKLRVRRACQHNGTLPFQFGFHILQIPGGIGGPGV